MKYYNNMLANEDYRNYSILLKEFTGQLLSNKENQNHTIRGC